MALVLSFALWNLADISIKKTGSFSAIVNVVAPKGFKVSNIEPTGPLELTIEGTGEILDRYLASPPSEILLRPDPEKITFGDSDTANWQVKLTAEDLGLRENLVLVKPPTITFTVTHVTTRNLPVMLQFENAEGVNVDEQASRTVPQTVTVTGPRKVMANATRILTVPIDLSGRADDFVEHRVATEQQIDGVPVECAELVTAYVVILPAPLERTFENTPVTLRVLPGSPYYYTLVDSPARIDVTVRGPAEKVNAVKQDDVILMADTHTIVDKAAAVRQGTPTHVPLRCILPPGVELAGELPDIKVEIKSRLAGSALPAQ